MGLWDWFRKKIEIEEVKVEKIALDEIDKWFSNKKIDIENKEREFLKLVQERINQLIKELEEDISILKSVNVNNKKAEEKVKLIVKENLKNYIEHLEKLKEKLEEIKADKHIIEKINFIFPDFEKKSKMSFEKATLLIGKEIGKVKDSTRNFFREVERLVKENQELIKKIETIVSIDKKIRKITEIKKEREEQESRINNLKEKIGNKWQEIENIKSSEKFAKEEEKKQEIEKKRQELDIEISKLRESIDFKALAKFYHSFEKEMSMIKGYKENFREQFLKTNGEELLNLFAESKIQDVGILNKIGRIRELKKELDEKSTENLGIEGIESEIKKTNFEIKTINDEKSAEERRHEKLEKSLNEIDNSLKGELLKINVEVE